MLPYSVQWTEGTGVKTLDFTNLDIRVAIVTATNGATADITSTIRDMVVDNRLLVVNTANINQLTGGDIAPGYVKTLNIDYHYTHITIPVSVGLLKQLYDSMCSTSVPGYTGLSVQSYAVQSLTSPSE